MRILSWIWKKLTQPDEYATCICSRCNGVSRPTRGMIRHDFHWYCCEDAYNEYRANLQDW